MAGYLGQANVTAELGGPGSSNPDMWLATFRPQDIGISLGEFECYRVVVNHGPGGSTFRIYIGGARLWDTVFPGNDTAWDPNNAMPLAQSDTVEFRWDSGDDTTDDGTGAPDVWMYFRERPVLT